MKAIYKFNLDCGRMGNLSGEFVADSEEIDSLINDKKEIYFGEVLGKHSEIIATLEESNFTMATNNAEFIALFEQYGLGSGHNPFDYLE